MVSQGKEHSKSIVMIQGDKNILVQPRVVSIVKTTGV